MFAVRLAAIAGGILAVLAQASPAFAVAARTYVSVNGANNPGDCPRTAPCRTLNYAIEATSPGGEITILDSGDLGNVDILKSVTIAAAGVRAGLTGTQTQVYINGAGIVVHLRGLAITGAPASSNLLVVQNALAVTIERCEFRSFNAAILVTNAAGPTRLHVADTTFSNGFYGVWINHINSGKDFADLLRVRTDSVAYPIYADGRANDGEVQVQVKDSMFASSFNGINVLSRANRALTVVSLTRTHVVDGIYGVLTEGPRAVTILDGSTIQANTQAFSTSNGAVVYSYGNNAINNNVAFGPAVAPLPLQ
jgi:hypothetical protein